MPRAWNRIVANRFWTAAQAAGHTIDVLAATVDGVPIYLDVHPFGGTTYVVWHDEFRFAHAVVAEDERVTRDFEAAVRAWLLWLRQLPSRPQSLDRPPGTPY